MIPLLPGMASLAPSYDGFIVDLWGVVHNGLAPYPAAMDCLARLAGKPVLLLSNAPRRADAVRATLRRMGVSDSLYTEILTSGEATWLALRDRTDPWFAGLGTRVYHIGPPRDRGVIACVGLTLAASPGVADFVLNTGPDDERDIASINEFAAELRLCMDAGLKMICANPDLEVMRGEARVLCAGALAVWYQDHGGDVCWIGKPHAGIYDMATGILGLHRDKILAIGDSLRTDIAGATAAGIDSLWVLGGVHATELSEDLVQKARQFGSRPKAMVTHLAW